MTSVPISEICAAFGLGAVESVHPVSGGTRNTNLAVVTTAGKWLVRRRHPDYAAPDRIAFDHGIMTTLAGNGVPVPAPMSAPTGETTLSAGDEGAWEVFPFVTGRQLEAGSPGDLAALAAGLGHLHAAGRTVSLRFGKLGPRGETSPADLRKTCAALDTSAPDAAPALEAYEPLLESGGGKLTDADWAALPHTIVHGDVQPANVLVQESRIAAFVDWDWCAWRPRLYDVCWAILFCCGTCPGRSAVSDIWTLTECPVLTPERVGTFLQDYQGTGGALTDIERRALVPQLQLTWCHTRLRGALKVPAADRAAFLARACPDVTACS